MSSTALSMTTDTFACAHSGGFLLNIGVVAWLNRTSGDNLCLFYFGLWLWAVSPCFRWHVVWHFYLLSHLSDAHDASASAF